MKTLFSYLFVFSATLFSQVFAQGWPFSTPKPVCSTMNTNCTKWPVANGNWTSPST